MQCRLVAARLLRPCRLPVGRLLAGTLSLEVEDGHAGGRAEGQRRGEQDAAEYADGVREQAREERAHGVAHVAPEAVGAQGGGAPAGVGVVADGRQVVCVHDAGADAQEERADEEAGLRVPPAALARHRQDREAERASAEAGDDQPLAADAVAREAEETLEDALREAVAQRDVGHGVLAQGLPTELAVDLVVVLHPLREEAPRKAGEEVDHQAREADGHQCLVHEGGVDEGRPADGDLRRPAARPSQARRDGRRHGLVGPAGELGLFAHRDRLRLLEDEAADQDAGHGQAEHDVVVAGPGIVLVQDGRGDLRHDGDRRVADGLVQADSDAGVLLPQVVDHDEDRRAPDQRLIMPKKMLEVAAVHQLFA
mmetsp:Transcript_15472/g.48705  ORF Transcript_15472/g.48705 Transcript_15472/m.48705 type:complete len:368 (-) Transcript_15472:528-1631(-)